MRDGWGFDGVLVSDWNSTGQMIPHGYSVDLKDAARQSITAGMDVDMMSYAYTNHLLDLVKEGKVKESEIDAAVRNVLRLKIRLGLFENPYIEIPGDDVFYTEEALASARQSVSESAIMLKNNDVLPITGVRSVAVVGPMADAGLDQMGTWSLGADPTQSITPLAAIRKEYPNVKVNYAPGLAYSRVKDQKGFAQAVAAAKSSDVVLYFAGEEAILSGEAKCLADISLPGAQRELLAALKATGKPVVMVVIAGRAVTMEQELTMADAVLYLFHGGSMTGPGLADVIFGKVSPSGKLPITMPKMVGQLPMYYNHKNTGRPAENITLIDDIPYGAEQFSVGATCYHLDAGDKPLFPFGYGLSYTEFEYGPVTLNTSTIKEGEGVYASCVVTNTGKYDAYEVVQCYMRDMVGELCRPVRELKGFEKIFIKAGESKNVAFYISHEDLGYWHADMKHYADKGEFQVWIAPHSATGVPASFVYQ